MRSYKLNNDEVKLIKKFKESRMPTIFKDIYIDFLLMVENMTFYICDLLLKGKPINDDTYTELISDFEEIIKNIDVKKD